MIFLNFRSLIFPKNIAIGKTLSKFVRQVAGGTFNLIFKVGHNKF